MPAQVIEGSFQRQESRFRGWVQQPAPPGRYHLYIARACPWSHRALIVHRLKGIDEDALGISSIHPYRDERGWAFPGGEHVDALHGWDFLAEAYEQSVPGYDGRVSVPVLWDRETGQIVSNESADIVRMLGADFDAHAEHPELDLYPAALREEIDAVEARVYEGLNNGVYRAGFARSQAAYDAAVADVFATLDWLEERLRGRTWLVGERITEADWRLFVTLVRFDEVYHLHFRCNRRRVDDYPELWDYARALHQQPGVAETVDMAEIKRHYYTTHDELNPKRIIPVGPGWDWSEPTRRG